jgi:type IV secretory pathway VirB4 component
MALNSRFEHTYIVGGTGHGKTQLLQHMILKDLDKLSQGKGSVIVIDSQGDLLRNIIMVPENSDTLLR